MKWREFLISICKYFDINLVCTACSHPFSKHDFSGTECNLLLYSIPDGHRTAETCDRTKAPPGWYCSRKLNHEGPCAAYEVVDDEFGQCCCPFPLLFGEHPGQRYR